MGFYFYSLLIFYNRYYDLTRIKIHNYIFKQFLKDYPTRSSGVTFARLGQGESTVEVVNRPPAGKVMQIKEIQTPYSPPHHWGAKVSKNSTNTKGIQRTKPEDKQKRSTATSKKKVRSNNN